MSNYLAEQYFIEAEELIYDSKYAEGKKKLEEIVEMEPGYGRAHFRLGWLYLFKFWDYERANYHLRLAIKFSPEYPVSYHTYAFLLNEINHLGAMKTHAARALAVRGVEPTIIYTELAKSFELNGNYAEAICNYRNAIKFSLYTGQVEGIEKHIERVKTKMKTFKEESFVYEISK
jgi:tetratricopeptide (TPR) repeat protein